MDDHGVVLPPGVGWLAKGLVDAIAKDLKRDAEAAKKRDAEAKRSRK